MLLLLFAASEVRHFFGVANSWVGGCGGGSWGGGGGKVDKVWVGL